ncbi:MAG: hypothetical protein IKU15_00305 [Clostridia bacterium]|nr:hypothetical protein [Clostridia bacterium]MBR4889743.1 hypothetical protein [Clostridia bacterium]
MPIIVPKKSKSYNTTILASQLQELRPDENRYDAIKTVLGNEITGDEETINRYLQLIGVQNYDKYFNQLIKDYSSQLQEQQLAAETQADIAYQNQANIAAEASQQLGTGARAIQSNQFEQARVQTSQQIDASMQQAQADFVSQLDTQYQSMLESVLGKQDEQGNYANVQKYIQQAEKYEQATFTVLAEALGFTIDDGDVYDYLGKLGIFDVSLNIDGSNDYILTELGYQQLDLIMNTDDAFGKTESGRGISIYDKIVEQMGQSEYGQENWDLLDDDKRLAIEAEYREWLENNGFMLRATNLGLASYNNGNLVVDTFYNIETLPADLESLRDVIEKDSITVYDSQVDTLFATDIEAEQLGTEIEDVATQLRIGQIGNGTLLLGNDDSYYIYSSGMLYKTKYSKSDSNIGNNGIDVDIMHPTIFGKFWDSDKVDTNQYKYAQQIIDDAQAGKFADGQMIDVNYGVGVVYIWEYRNGKLINHGQADVKQYIDPNTVRTQGIYQASTKYYETLDGTKIWNIDNVITNKDYE